MKKNKVLSYILILVGLILFTILVFNLRNPHKKVAEFTKTELDLKLEHIYLPLDYNLSIHKEGARHAQLSEDTFVKVINGSVILTNSSQLVRVLAGGDFSYKCSSLYDSLQGLENYSCKIVENGSTFNETSSEEFLKRMEGVNKYGTFKGDFSPLYGLIKKLSLSYSLSKNVSKEGNCFKISERTQAGGTDALICFNENKLISYNESRWDLGDNYISNWKIEYP